MMRTMKTRPVFLAILAAFALGAAACDGDKSAQPPAKAPAGDKAVAAADTKPAADKPDATKPADKVKVVEGGDPADDRFTVNIEPPSDVGVGNDGKVKITVVPKAPWHMNLDYPTALDINAPSGIKLTKSNLKKGDADKLDENSAEFGVAFTAEAAGDKEFTGEFRFAVCQDDACAPVKHDVNFKVAVK